MKKKIIILTILAAFMAMIFPVVTLASSLNSSYWSTESGAINYSGNIISYTVDTKPNRPYQVAWGKNQGVRRGYLYTLKFDAYADNYNYNDEVPISLRIHERTSPWTRYSEEKIIKLNRDNKYYEVELLSTTDDINATITVWTGYEAADYRFSNISLSIKDSGLPTPDPLDFSWWSTQNGAVERGINRIAYDIRTLPANPWNAAWGKLQGVRKDKLYVISFDAKAESYTGESRVPVSLRLYLNRPPWTNYSMTEYVDLDASLRHFRIELYSVAAESDATLAVWTGHAAAKYEFKNLKMEIKEPDEIIETKPLDASYWSNQSGAIDFGLGIIDLHVPSVRTNPWDVSWGKSNAIENGATYVLKFDAKADSREASVPIKLLLYKNFSPWESLAREQEIRLDSTKKTYEIEFKAASSERNSTVAIWTGLAAADYEFMNISFVRK